MYHRNNYARGQSAIVRAVPSQRSTPPELIISIAIMVMIAGAMAVLSNGVQSAVEHTQGLDLASQHGRIAMSRIDNNPRDANESFPGVFVLSTTSGSYTFPGIRCLSGGLMLLRQTLPGFHGTRARLCTRPTPQARTTF
ncbi:MAG: hypothetical protein U0894_13850 [Pirellulales bacterium]